MQISVQGKKVVELREKLLWSRARLAQAAGMSLSTLQSIEQAEMKNIESGTVHKLAKGLGMDVNALVEMIRPAPSSGDFVTVTVKVPVPLAQRHEQAASKEGKTLAEYIEELAATAAERKTRAAAMPTAKKSQKRRGH